MRHLDLGLVDVCFPGRVDPGLGWHRRRHGDFADEALWIGLVCLCQDVLTGGMDGLGLAVMHLVGGHQSNADVMVTLIVPSEEAAAECPGILNAAETLGDCGWYFRVLKCASEKGLSFEVCGLLCDLVTPRSANRKAVGLAFIGPPRSACSVSWPGKMPCLAKASSKRALNRTVFSASATHQPTTRRLKI